MAVAHVTAIRDVITNAVVDAIDAGAGAGYIEFQDSGDTEVATLAFTDPAFGASSSAVATADTISDDTTATGGTIAKARFKDSDDTEVLSCSVTATSGGGDIELTGVVIGVGSTVSMSALTYTAPV